MELWEGLSLNYPIPASLGYRLTQTPKGVLNWNVIMSRSNKIHQLWRSSGNEGGGSGMTPLLCPRGCGGFSL